MVIGPTLLDLNKIGLDGDKLSIATAFYSRRALNSLSIGASEVDFFVRLDLQSTKEWEAGCIAPDSLLEVAGALDANGQKVSLFSSPYAHAKTYVGDRAAMYGSANLTLRGFGGGAEIVAMSFDSVEIQECRDALQLYKKKLRPLSLATLKKYVESNSSRINQIAKAQQDSEDQLPNTDRDSIPSVGSYNDFRKWLAKQTSEAANEILERSYGKGQLSGHIHKNFYGLRQFFLAYPELITKFSKLDAEKYKLSRDFRTEQRIANFVRHHAVNEGEFRLNVWKTYLPIECGGRAAKHGGTIGNLNRMMPLVARYLLRRSGS